MLQGDPEAALGGLKAAVAAGFSGVAALAADLLFAPLSGDPRLAALATAAPTPPPPLVPALTRDGTAEVSGANTAWNPETEQLEAHFAFAAAGSGERVVTRNRRDNATTCCATSVIMAAPRATTATSTTTATAAIPAGIRRTSPAAHVTYYAAARAADSTTASTTGSCSRPRTLGNSSTAITEGALWR